MNLQESIRRILNEETDLSHLITKFLNDLIVKRYDIVCKIEVTAPWNRESISNHKYNFYKILIYFNTGFDTKYWPRTMAVRDKEEEIINEVWDKVYSVFSIPTDLYSKSISKCEERDVNLQESIRRILIEENNKPNFFLRRVDFDMVEKIIPSIANEIYYNTDSYEQFKYELTLTAVETYLWNEYDLTWDELPEQEEIEFVKETSNRFEKTIKRLYDRYNK